ncbi:hypothetical protein [Sinorhizobium fredii]|uniref:hypothetical protein n=1 Tax=Rhizobium fredii TaxID=380 RepID=UPI003510EA98
MSGTETTPDAAYTMSTVQAEAAAVSVKDKPDPLKRIPPSLLAAEHIIAYVEKTGLVSPFDASEEAGRLKKASYEGRIGRKAFTFNDSTLEPVGFKDGVLKIAANSIVFVECDLEFRLPSYIALRFNLQIKHVHRGLLLGTGPIVDPGYWGKLCIPLHNLTNEDYFIAENEGIIWVDFTKTTLPSNATNSKGKDPSTKNTWDIQKFILKASNENGNGKLAPIQSSIGIAVESVRKESNDAKKVSERTESKVNKFAFWGLIVSIISIIGLAIGIYSLEVSHFSFYTTQTALYQNYINGSVSSINESIKNASEVADKRLDDFNRTVIPAQAAEIKMLIIKFDQLKADNESLRKEILDLKKSTVETGRRDTAPQR